MRMIAIGITLLALSGCQLAPAPQPTPQVSRPTRLPPTPTPEQAPTSPSLSGATPVPGQPTVTPQPLAAARTPLPTPTTPAAPTPATPGATAVAARPPRPAGCPTLPSVRRLAGLRVGAALDGGPDLAAQFDRATQIKARWVSVPVRWAMIEPQRGSFDWAATDQALRAAEERGLALLFVVRDAPAWAASDDVLPDDPADLARFLQALAGRYTGKVRAYQIWELPNKAADGRNAASPERYAEALVAGSAALRSADPCAFVLGGGLLPSRGQDVASSLDDLAYYQGVLGYDKNAVVAAYDALAVPLLTGGAEPGDNTRDADERYRRFAYLSRLRNEQLFQGEGDKQIWATLGWPLTPGDDEPSAVTPEQQAEYLADALERARERYPFVATLLVRGLGTTPPPAGAPDYRLVGDDGAPRPAFVALAERRVRGLQPDPRDGFAGASSVGLLWTHKINPDPSPGSALAADDSLRLGSGGPWAYAVDSNGAFRWSYRLGGQQKLTSVAVDAEGSMYLASDQRLLAAVGPDSNTRWDLLLPEPLDVPPTIAGDVVYAPLSASLAAHNASDGSSRWQVALGGKPGRVAVAADGVAYVGTTDGALHAIGPDGSVRWTTGTERWVRAAPLVRADGSLVVTTDGGSVLAFDAQGQPLWRFDGVGALTATPAAAPDGTLYVPSSEGVLYALTPQGALIWQVALPGPATFSPIVNSNGTILVTSGAALLAIGADANERWRFNAPAPLVLAPQLNADGLVLTADTEGVVYGIGPLALRDRLGWP
jgi:outer membrane protein assembly factor BamB